MDMVKYNGNDGGNDGFKNYLMIVYALYALGLVSLITPLAGVVVAYVKRGDMRGTFYESHMTYLIKTFWMALGVGLVGLLTLWLVVGFGIWLLLLVWFVYRVVAGFVKLTDGKPVRTDTWF